MTLSFFVSENIIVGYSQPQDRNEKKITKEVFKNEPIEIIEIKSDEKVVKLDEDFTRKNNWLKGLTVKFKNISGRTIVYVSSVIGFPETDSSGNPTAYFLKYGVHPLVKNYGKDKPESLAPDETAELILSAKRYEMLNDFLATRRYSLDDLKETHFTIVTIYFDNGTHWSAGTIYKPDPNRPGKFIADNKQSQ